MHLVTTKRNIRNTLMKDITYNDTRHKATRVFLDTNILLDYMSFRSEEALAVEYLVDMCIRGTIECCIAAHSLTDLFYIIRKDYTESDRNQIILTMCDVCHVQEISRDTIKQAIAAGYSRDLEDALQMQCAVDSHADFLLTRDRNGFDKSPVKVLLPHELIHELKL